MLRKMILIPSPPPPVAVVTRRISGSCCCRRRCIYNTTNLYDSSASFFYQQQKQQKPVQIVKRTTTATRTIGTIVRQLNTITSTTTTPTIDNRTNRTKTAVATENDTTTTTTTLLLPLPVPIISSSSSSFVLSAIGATTTNDPNTITKTTTTMTNSFVPNNNTNNYNNYNNNNNNNNNKNIFDINNNNNFDKSNNQNNNNNNITNNNNNSNNSNNSNNNNNNNNHHSDSDFDDDPMRKRRLMIQMLLRTMGTVVIGIPLIAIGQGAYLLYDYRKYHGTAPRPMIPSSGMVVVTSSISSTSTNDNNNTDSHHQITNNRNNSSSSTSNKNGNSLYHHIPSGDTVTTSVVPMEDHDDHNDTDHYSFEQEPLRLLVIGDSLAAGVGTSESSTPVLPESIAIHLSKALRGRPVHWICTGVPGYTAGEIVNSIHQLDNHQNPSNTNHHNENTSNITTISETENIMTSMDTPTISDKDNNNSNTRTTTNNDTNNYYTLKLTSEDDNDIPNKGNTNNKDTNLVVRHQEQLMNQESSHKSTTTNTTTTTTTTKNSSSSSTVTDLSRNVPAQSNDDGVSILLRKFEDWKEETRKQAKERYELSKQKANEWLFTKQQQQQQEKKDNDKKQDDQQQPQQPNTSFVPAVVYQRINVTKTKIQHWWDRKQNDIRKEIRAIRDKVVVAVGIKKSTRMEMEDDKNKKEGTRNHTMFISEGKYDIAIVLTGLNDLKDTYLPFMIDKEKKKIKQGQEQQHQHVDINNSNSSTQTYQPEQERSTPLQGEDQLINRTMNFHNEYNHNMNMSTSSTSSSMGGESKCDEEEVVVGEKEEEEEQLGLKAELIRIIDALRNKMKQAKDESTTILKPPPITSLQSSNDDCKNRAAVNSTSPDHAVQDFNTNPATTLIHHDSTTILPTSTESDCADTTTAVMEWEGPLVVFPALPYAPLEFTQWAPLCWFVVPLLRGIDHHKETLATLYPGYVLYVESPNKQIIYDAENHIGPLWSTSNEENEKIHFKLTDVTLNVHERILSAMKQHYDRWRQQTNTDSNSSNNINPDVSTSIATINEENGSDVTRMSEKGEHDIKRPFNNDEKDPTFHTNTIREPYALDYFGDGISNDSVMNEGQRNTTSQRKNSNNNKIGSTMIAADGIHPNDNGYDMWGRHIAQAIVHEMERNNNNNNNRRRKS